MPTPAEAYEAFMVPPFFAPWAERLADRARPAPGAAVLDVGSGTGIVARRLAARVGGGRVVGLDASADDARRWPAPPRRASASPSNGARARPSACRSRTRASTSSPASSR